MEHLDLVGLLRALQSLERNASVSLMYSGLRVPQFRLLDKLSEMQRATVTELSRILGITRASASVLVNELVRAGVVSVVDNEKDRRSFYVELTDLGAGKLSVARSDLSVLQRKLNARMEDETIAALNRFAKEFAGTKDS